MTTPEDASRRRFLKRSAAAGAIAWTVPTVLSMQPAQAGSVDPGGDTRPPPPSGE